MYIVHIGSGLKIHVTATSKPILGKSLGLDEKH